MTADVATKPGSRVVALMAARSRYFEDRLAAATARGATQYVLGAGLDAIAYGIAGSQLRVFDVDNPAALRSPGFDKGAVTFFSWLGAAPFRTAETALATLAFAGSLPEGSSVVFDYAAKRSSLDFMGEMAMDILASRVSGAGQALRLLLDPGALNGLLRAAGFHRIEDLGPGEIEERYFAGRVRAEAGLAHFVHAWV